MRLEAGPPGPGAPVDPLDRAAGWIESASLASPPESVELLLEGDDPGGAPAAFDVAPPGEPAAPGLRLESVLHRLRLRGGSLTCVTHGVLRGPQLEIAMMADLHLMSRGSSIEPYGLFSGYIPRAGGWSRLIDRAGAGRAAGLLLSGERLDAEQALASGLCDALVGEGRGRPREEAPEEAGGSPAALRLARELTHRRGRSGGITPRQARVLERASFALAFASRDPREGIASFFERRPPRYAPPPPAGTGQQDKGITG